MTAAVATGRALLDRVFPRGAILLSFLSLVYFATGIIRNRVFANTYGAGAELDRETVTAGLLAVESRVAFEPYPAGAHELQGLDRASAVELGEVLAGTREGRTSPEEITVYKSMGHAVEDAAAAGLVYRRAREQGIGTEVEL